MNIGVRVCPICGSNNIVKKDGEWFCESCGTFLFDKAEADNEKVIFLARVSDAESDLKLSPPRFEDAERKFDRLIKEYPTTSSVYWGKVRAKYGIKYETDFDGKCIPCCYKSKYFDIRKDKNFLKAVELAENPTLKEKYISEAEKIAAVWKEWETKAKNFDYDVFLSFKVNDNGVETEDCVLMREIYTYLTEQGFKVFYSPVTMREYVGKPFFDAYIFNALESSEVLICCGLKSEYLSTTWVENEWTRYLTLIQNGEKQLDSLIVLYGDYNPSLELPSQLASRQGLSAFSRTVFPDILRIVKNIKAVENRISALEHVDIKKNEQGIKKVTDIINIELENFGVGQVPKKEFIQSKEVSFKELPKATYRVSSPNINDKLDTAEKMLKNAFYEDAISFYEDCLREDNTNLRAFAGLLATKNHDLKLLDDLNPNVEFVKRTLEASECENLKNYIPKFNNLIEKAENAMVGERIIQFLTLNLLSSIVDEKIYIRTYFSGTLDIYRVINAYNTPYRLQASKIISSAFETVYNSNGSVLFDKMATEIVESIPSGELDEYLAIIESVICLANKKSDLHLAEKWNLLKLKHCDCDVNSLFRGIYYTCHVQDQNAFVDYNMTNKCAYKVVGLLEDISKRISKEDAITVFNSIQAVELACLKDNVNVKVTHDNARIYFNFLTKFKYDARDAFIQKNSESIDVLCKNNETDFVLDIIEKMNLGQDPDAYLNMLRDAGEKMLSYEHFTSADVFFNKMFEIQENNFFALRGLLYSRIKFNLKNYTKCNINVLFDDEEIKNVLSYSPNKEEETALIKTLIFAALCTLRSSDIDNINFKKSEDKLGLLLKLFDGSDKDKCLYLNEIARVYLTKGNFEKTINYANISLQVEQKDNVDARFVVLLASLKCKNELELIKCPMFNRNSVEFRNLLVACSNDEEKMKRFLSLADKAHDFATGKNDFATNDNLYSNSKKTSSTQKNHYKPVKHPILETIFVLMPVVLSVVFGIILFQNMLQLCFKTEVFGFLVFLWLIFTFYFFISAIYFFTHRFSARGLGNKFSKSAAAVGIVASIISSIIVFPCLSMREKNYDPTALVSFSVKSEYVSFDGDPLYVNLDYTINNKSQVKITYVKAEVYFYNQSNKLIGTNYVTTYDTLYVGSSVHDKNYMVDFSKELIKTKNNFKAKVKVTKLRIKDSLTTFTFDGEPRDVYMNL